MSLIEGSTFGSLGLGIGALSAAGSLIGDIFEQNAAKKAKEDAINAYKKLLIPSIETDKRADRAGDTLYTKAMSELNNGAFAGRGALNPETLKTIAYTKMASARAETELNVTEEDFKYNRGIQSQIAGIEAQPIPTINPINALEAGVGGYFSGEQLGMAQELLDSQKDLNQSQTNYYNRLELGKPTNTPIILKPNYGIDPGFNPLLPNIFGKKKKDPFGGKLNIRTYDPYGFSRFGYLNG